MVGYGSSLIKARRKGWEMAYLDYSELKLLLVELNEVIQRYCSDINEETKNKDESSSLLERGLSGEDVFPTSFNTEIEVEAQIQSKAEDFLQLLRKEVEKVSLYAISRQGELADAIGSLKFNCDEVKDSLERPLSLQHHSDSEIFSVVVSDDDSAENQISSAAENTLVDDLSVLLPSITQLQGCSLNLNSSVIDHRRLKMGSHPMFKGSGIFRKRITKDDNISIDNNNGEHIRSRQSSDSENWVPLTDEGIGLNRILADDDISLDESCYDRNIDDFTIVAIEVLHLMRYICINAMAVRKIIKKYEKTLQKCTVQGCNIEERANTDENNNARFISPLDQMQDCHDKHVEQLQHLATSKSMAALTASIMLASANSTAHVFKDRDASTDVDEPILRFKCAIDCIDILREYAEVVNQSFPAFLSRQAMIVTGQQLGDLGGMKIRALEVILKFDPDTILRMDKIQLSQWQERCWNYSYGVGKRLRTTSFDSLEEDGFPHEKHALSWGGVDGTSMYINLISIFLYTVNYYIVSPTANRYAILLGSHGAYGSTLIGAASLAAFFGSFLYSWWYTRFSFKSALAFSSFISVIGNLLYAVAISFESIKVAFVGRLLVGLGSAEVINRQIISSCVHYNYMTRASALFVVASALGMSVGPLLAAVLDDMAGRDIEIDFIVPAWIPHIGGTGIIFDNVTSPAFLMALLWLIEFLATIFTFKEPIRVNSFKKKDEVTKQKSWFSELREVKNLIFENAALPVTLTIYCYIELLDEILLSSCAMVCKRYFAWNGSVAGYILAALGALVLPADFIVDKASRYYEERVILRFSLLYICLGLVVIINFQGLFIDVGLVTTNAELLLNKTNAVSTVYNQSTKLNMDVHQSNSSDVLQLTEYHNETLVDFIDSNNSQIFLNASAQDWDEMLQNNTQQEGSNIVIYDDRTGVNQTVITAIINDSPTAESSDSSLSDDQEVFSTKTDPYDWSWGAIIYLFGLSTIFMATVVLEGVDTSLLSISSPSKLNSTFLSVGLITTLAGTVGRVLADFLITISAIVDRLPFADFVNATFVPLIPITLFCMFLVKQYYSSLIYK